MMYGTTQLLNSLPLLPCVSCAEFAPCEFISIVHHFELTSVYGQGGTNIQVRQSY